MSLGNISGSQNDYTATEITLNLGTEISIVENHPLFPDFVIFFPVDTALITKAVSKIDEVNIQDQIQSYRLIHYA